MEMTPLLFYQASKHSILSTSTSYQHKITFYGNINQSDKPEITQSVMFT